MKYIKVTLIFLMSVFTVACGGGSGSDSNTTNASPTVADVVVEQPIVQPVEEAAETPVETVEEIVDVVPDPNATYETTAELVAASTFLFTQEYELDVSYINTENRSAYLSICTDFTQGDNTIEVNYNSCLLRTSTESDYNATLSVANDQDRLVMAIWYLDDMKNPRYEVWQNDMGDMGEKQFTVN